MFIRLIKSLDIGIWSMKYESCLHILGEKLFFVIQHLKKKKKQLPRSLNQLKEVLWHQTQPLGQKWLILILPLWFWLSSNYFFKISIYFLFLLRLKKKFINLPVFFPYFLEKKKITWDFSKVRALIWSQFMRRII